MTDIIGVISDFIGILSPEYVSFCKWIVTEVRYVGVENGVPGPQPQQQVQRALITIVQPSAQTEASGGSMDSREASFKKGSHELGRGIHFQAQTS